VALVRGHLAANPFSTLQVVVDTDAEFPLDVLEELGAASAPTVALYLDRYHAFTPGAPPAARRLVVALPANAWKRIDADWVDTALQLADVVWLEPRGRKGTPRPGARPGEWFAGR
jgi:hypothetical protein